MMAYPMATESNSNFYQGPAMMMQPMQQSSDLLSDLETRVAKLERQINRFDSRISKLESDISPSNLDNNYTANNMYMV